MWLDLEVWLDGGKPILKIQKLNLCLLQLCASENAMQCTPPKAHSAGADYGIYNVLNWNAEEGGLQHSSVQPTRAFSVSISNVNLSFCT